MADKWGKEEESLEDSVFQADTCHTLTGYNCNYIPKSPADFEKHLDQKHGGR